MAGLAASPLWYLGTLASGMGYVSGLKMGLWRNPGGIPLGFTDPSSLLQPTYPGYALQTPSWGTPEPGSFNATVIAAPVEWLATVSVPAQQVFGWFLLDQAAGQVVLCVEPANVPQLVGSSITPLTITVRLTQFWLQQP